MIADPLDRVTAGLHLFLHSIGPPDEPDQPTLMHKHWDYVQMPEQRKEDIFICSYSCHQLDPAWKMESISSFSKPTVDKAVQRCWKSLPSRSCNSDILIWAVGLSLRGDKQMGSGKMTLLYMHEVLQKESILEHHLSSPNK